jgi:putative intracellular protease/amidase
VNENLKGTSAMTAKSILIVVTSYEEMRNGERTGIWLSEFAEPYEVFIAEGYQVTVASILGGKAPIDPRSTKVENVARWPEAIQQLERTVAITQVKSEGYDAIFLPGGHGTMFDLPDSVELQSLIREFAETDRVVAAVCHGPAGLINVKLSDGQYYVKGKKVTGFTNEEEYAAKMDMFMPFLLEDRLREARAEYVAAALWENHVESDGNLITGQNPQSSESIARKIVEVLGSRKVQV